MPRLELNKSSQLLFLEIRSKVLRKTSRVVLKPTSDDPVQHVGVGVFNTLRAAAPTQCVLIVFTVTPFVHVQIKYAHGHGDNDPGMSLFNSCRFSCIRTVPGGFY